LEYNLFDVTLFSRFELDFVTLLVKLNEFVTILLDLSHPTHDLLLYIYIDFVKKDMLDNVRGNLCCPCKHCKNEKKYRTDDVLWSHLIKHRFMEDYRRWNKYGKEGLNKAEMRDSYLEREVTIGVEEEHNYVNKADILGLTDDDIEFQVHNIEEMVCIVERHDDDDL
jgi:hypothetical protein